MTGALDGKIALVTGAGSGIGRATAIYMAKEGAHLIISDISDEGAHDTLDEIKAFGGDAHFVRADVSQKSDVDHLMAETLKTFGRLDCAFNNAGIEGQPAPTTTCTIENWDRTIAVNLTGVWHCMSAELAIMQDQGAGTIVNMASIAGLVGFENLPAYTASKHGVIGLTKTAALENAASGIRINAVCPGVIDTPMVARFVASNPEAKKALTEGEPIGRIGQPEEIATAVTWLCSDAASFVTGISMPIDGGWVAR